MSHRAEEENANPNIVRCWASHSESARTRRQNQTWTNLNSATVLVPQVSSERLVLAKGETIRESNRDRRLAPTRQHKPSLLLIISPSPEIKNMQEKSYIINHVSAVSSSSSGCDRKRLGGMSPAFLVSWTFAGLLLLRAVAEGGAQALWGRGHAADNPNFGNLSTTGSCASLACYACSTFSGSSCSVGWPGRPRPFACARTSC